MDADRPDRPTLQPLSRTSMIRHDVTIGAIIDHPRYRSVPEPADRISGTARGGHDPPPGLREDTSAIYTRRVPSDCRIVLTAMTTHPLGEVQSFTREGPGRLQPCPAAIAVSQRDQPPLRQSPPRQQSADRIPLPAHRSRRTDESDGPLFTQLAAEWARRGATVPGEPDSTWQELSSYQSFTQQIERTLRDLRLESQSAGPLTPMRPEEVPPRESMVGRPGAKNLSVASPQTESRAGGSPNARRQVFVARYPWCTCGMNV